jgi:glycosyltransferase involved in cell wall biosynthesis
MASLVGGVTERAFVSIPAWRSKVGGVTAAGTPVAWLPVPSGIPPIQDRAASAAIRARYGPDGPLVGHFGTYGDLIKPLLEPCVNAVVEASSCRVLLLGQGSESACHEFVVRNPRLLDRVYGVGALPADDLSRHLSACDVMMQPYPDGISTRRTSAMVALTHGVPVVSTSGPLTEPLWAKSNMAVLVPSSDPIRMAAETLALLDDPIRRAALSQNAFTTYDEQFDLRHTIAALRFPA